MKKILLTILALTALVRANPSTLGEGDSYSWGANFGWIEMAPNRPNTGDGFRFGEFACSGWIWSANTGWIDCGDGTPANGINYANDSHTDYGVNHYGNGNLYGLAWSPNTGWINFGWWTSDPENPNRPRVDLHDGNFSGYAWSANCGWINLGTGLLKTDTMAVADTDNDGISDAYEIAYTGGLGTLGTNADADKDGHSDEDEYHAMSNPVNPASFFKVTNISPNTNGSATALTWTSAPNRRYAIEVSTDLGASDPWHQSSLDPLSFDADSGEFTTRTTRDVAAPKRFFRVRAIIPLQP